VDQRIDATAQRAVLWLRGGAWEIHIQPVFDRARGKAAWVVPFPALPEVSQSNADLFRDLELLTSPVFITYCTHDYDSGSGCSANDRAGSNQNGSGEKSGVAGSVKVWDQGEVGELTYVVLSASEGDDLVMWLETNGYVIPEGGESLIADFETEGQFFFVAQLSEDADPSLPISPVRFQLPDMETPLYPLRLTGLAVEPDQRLDLTLWVVYPDPGAPQEEGAIGFAPDSHPYEKLDGNPMDPDAYEQAVDTFFSERTPDHLLVEHGRPLGDWDSPVTQRARCDSGNYYGVCASLDDLGYGDIVWSDEVQEMDSAKSYVYRYTARLDPVAMEVDLTLGEMEWSWDNISRITADNVFIESTGICGDEDDEEYVSCSVAKGLSFPGWFLLALLALTMLLAVRRTRSKT
jgi:hypothetical protein